MKKQKVVIIGAAGMDYHLFNMIFRNNSEYDVVAFTMAGEQNLGTTKEKLRSYPKSLAGKLYKKNIPTIPETDLKEFVQRKKIDLVVFAYSDISHEKLMHLASIVLSAGANFELISPKNLMLKSKKPVVAVTAVRTGCGKSQLSKYVMDYLKGKGIKAVAVREPMPYGDLEEQVAMRFASYDDLKKHDCTVEEREEYEQYIENGFIVYAGVDYEKILRKAEKEADVVVWDGGNNEIPFYKPDLWFVIADPLRAGDELKSHPGEVNFRMADFVVINKENSSDKKSIQEIVKNAKQVNPKAKIIHCDSIIKPEEKIKIKNKKVIVVEDGPTTTHGGLGFGAGFVYANKHGAKIISPEKYLTGDLKKVFKKFSHLKFIVPAMGYSKKQLKDLQETLNKAKADYIISGTPINLSKLIKTNKPIIRIKYAIKEKKSNNINKALNKLLKKFNVSNRVR